MIQRYKALNEGIIKKGVTLVAVSKFKPVQDIVDLYNTGHRDFGENYILSPKESEVKHLLDKSNSEELTALDQLRWHYIGKLQSGNINKLLQVRNLFMVHTIDSVKIAKKLNSALVRENKESQLKVLVQVNTDETKPTGVEVKQCKYLIEFILKECVKLKFCGLMTIGKIDDDKGECFDILSNVKKNLYEDTELKELIKVPEEEFELSMGMSKDYQLAIEKGSTIVRIGSTIFGARA
eukprot:snap_masked-scaffold_2-processed-gene-8.23-mRNA-1 protein AED:0.02 eAED:0.02 QI:0/-1/0/1/-1/1/1/0/236